MAWRGVTKVSAERASSLPARLHLLNKHILDLPTLLFFILLARFQTAQSTTPNPVTDVSN
jgi:hypothetical protein